MSEGKPTGADQSTSNGGGGGRTVDSGGGRESMSDGGGQIVNSGGGVNDGGDRGIADGSGSGETIQGGEGGENADAGGSGETMNSSVDGRTVDGADTARDGQLVYGGDGGIVDSNEGGESVNDVGGETDSVGRSVNDVGGETDSVGRSVNDVGGGGGTGHGNITADYGGGKQTVNDGGGGEVESDGTMNLKSSDQGTIGGGDSYTNNGSDSGTAESDTNETVYGDRRGVTINDGVGNTANGGSRGTADGGGETTDNIGGELSKNGSRRVTGNEEGNTNDSTTPSQFDDTDDTWVNVETPDTNESSQRNLEKASSSEEGSASPPNLFGLQIRIKDEVSTYPLSRATGTLKMTDWLSVRKEESTSPHIRCYWLDDGKEEELPAFMSIFNSKSNVLLLVNNKDNFKIDAKFLCTIKAYDFPVAVVTCSVGQILEDLLQKHKREVQGRLEMSTVTTNFQDETKQEPPQGFQRVVQVITNFVKPSRPVVDLVTPVQGLLFPSDKEARIASEDPDLFQKVMAEFNNFENEDGNQTEINNALSMLVKNSEDSFRRSALYRCDFVPTYWKTCIDRVESMDVDAITDTLKVFLRSGNFNISLNWKSYKEVQVLWCTQKAVINLLKERRPLQPLQIYPVMLWITIYLKLNSSMLAQTPQGSFWSENFLKDAHRYKLCDANIRGVKDAILLGERLELPPEISFNARCIGELLVPCNGKKVRLFSHQRETICELGHFFKFENEFLQCVVVNLRGSYEASVKSKARGYINVLSSHGTELGAIKEGLGLLDAMNKVYNEKKWKMETFDNECRKWLLFLLGFVNYSQTPEISLHEFISSKHYTVTRRHQTFISVQVVKTTKVYLQKFSANQFFTLYQKFEIWPEKLLDEYLESTPKSITLSEEPMWTEFFSEATKRLPCASKQTCIHRFLLQIAEHYEEKKKAIDFVYDILKVEVPDLFAVKSQNDEEAVTSFVQDLHTFIAQNQLKHKLRSNFKGVLMKLTKRSGRFQKIVLSAILKEIVPYPKDLQEMGFLPSWKHAVSAAVDNLKSNATWVEREPSVKQTFCLDFVNACCTLIKPSKNTFDWVEKYSTLIHQLGSIYCSHATNKNLTILLGTLPEDVTVNPSSAVEQYFLWIQNIHNILSTWKRNLNSRAANYDEIHGYIYKQQSIYEIAQHVSATELVVSEENLTCLNTAYLEKFEELNILLLKYVPGDSKPYWCSLVSVLSEHGVWLPTDLSDLLCESVLFPRQQNHGIKMVEQAPLPSITREFNPPSRTVKL